MTVRRIIAWLAGLIGLAVVLLLLAALLLPRVLDSQTVRERIRAFVLSKADADLAISKIDFTWFPRPVVTMRGISVSFGKQVTGTIQAITARPSVAGLLRRKFDISRVELSGFALSLALPADKENALDIDAVEGQLRDLLTSLATQAPRLIVAVSDSSVELRHGARPPLIITNLSGHLQGPPSALDIHLRSASNAFDSLQLELSIAADTLSTTGRARFERLRLAETLAAISPGPLPYLGPGDASLDVALTSVGFRKVQAKIEASAPSVTLVRGQRTTVIDGAALKAAVGEDQGIVRAAIERLDVRSPRMSLTGQVTVDETTSAVTSKLAAPEIDLSRIRASALEIAPDIPLVEEVSRHFKGGQARRVDFRGNGRSWAELWRNTTITAMIRAAKLSIPAFKLDLSDVSGRLAVAHRTLRATGVSARSGKVKGTEGTLRMGLTGPGAPFGLDMKLEADAAELRALMLRAIDDPGLHRTLSNIHGVGGQLSGRLVLGDKLDALTPKVFVTKAALNLTYDPIPYPISIEGGSFEYDAGHVEIEGVRGSVGQSSFSELTGRLRYRDSLWIAVDSGRLSIDVAEAKDLVSRLEGLPPAWQHLENARGRLDITALSLEGPLSDPGTWVWTGAGTFANITVQHSDLPGVLNISGGTFRATPKQLAIDKTTLAMLDSSLTVDGSMESPGKSPLDVEVRGTGSVGAQMVAWLKRELDVPDRFTPRAPVQVTDAHLRWKEGGDVALQGDLVIAAGPRLTVDLVRGHHALEVKQATITAGGHTARLALELGKGQALFSFSGILDQATLDRMFEVPPLTGVPIEAGLIEGDLEVGTSVEPPLRFHARGKLAGRDFRVPVAGESVHVESFDLEGDHSRVDVRSADFRWRDRRVTLQGRVEGDPSALHVDLDVSADRIVGDELRELLERGKELAASDGPKDRVLPTVEGLIRLKAGVVTFDRFASRPLQTAISLTPQKVSARIERGEVCGIGVLGTVDVTGGEVGLDLTLSATNGSLDATTVCLTPTQRVSGSFTLSARVLGRGSPMQVARTLSGEFQLVARDGRFLPTPTADTVLENTFDYLNHSGDFEVAFPDLDREAFPFQLATGRGRVDGLTVVLDEVVIESSRLTLGGNGRLDFDNGTIDARGVVTYRIPGGRVTGRIPVVGSILSGEALGIPVRVSGSLSSPDVRYLSAADVGAELLRIPVRILGIPLSAIRMFTPSMRRR